MPTTKKKIAAVIPTKIELQRIVGEYFCRTVFDELSFLMSVIINPTKNMGTSNPVNSFVATERLSAKAEITSQAILELLCHFRIASKEKVASEMAGSPFITAKLTRKKGGAIMRMIAANIAVLRLAKFVAISKYDQNRIAENARNKSLLATTSSPNNLIIPARI